MTQIERKWDVRDVMDIFWMSYVQLNLRPITREQSHAINCLRNTFRRRLGYLKKLNVTENTHKSNITLTWKTYFWVNINKDSYKHHINRFFILLKKNRNLRSMKIKRKKENFNCKILHKIQVFTWLFIVEKEIAL